jgi:rhodanese-related sulfurtransferase
LFNQPRIIMKTTFFIFFTLIFAMAFQPSVHAASKPVDDSNQQYKVIHTQEFKAIVNSDKLKNVILVDARPKKYYDGTRIANAKFLPSDASETLIQSTLPVKSTPIIVYCASIECPASKNLAIKLISLGYTNVTKYVEGIDGWVEAGNSMSKS